MITSRRRTVALFSALVLANSSLVAPSWAQEGPSDTPDTTITTDETPVTADTDSDQTTNYDVGGRVISLDDHWRANIYLQGMPLKAKRGDSFEIQLQIYENRDVPAHSHDHGEEGPDHDHGEEGPDHDHDTHPNESGLVVDENQDDELFVDGKIPASSGQLFLGATEGIAIDDIAWTCDNPFLEEALANEDPLAEQAKPGCENDPVNVSETGHGIVVDNTAYQFHTFSPYRLTFIAGWNITVRGTFTENGPQSFLFTAVDQTYVDAETQILEQAVENAISQQTIVSEDGTEGPDTNDPRPVVGVTTQITQDKDTVRNGQRRVYRVRYLNVGDAPLEDARVQGHYLLTPEDHATSVYTVRCDRQSSAPCPAWADGTPHEIELSHDHDHAHDIDREANTYDDVITLGGGEHLELIIEHTTTVDKEGGTEDRQAQFDAFIRGTDKVVLHPDSIRSDGIAGTLSLKDNTQPTTTIETQPSTEIQPSTEVEASPSAEPSNESEADVTTTVTSEPAETVEILEIPRKTAGFGGILPLALLGLGALNTPRAESVNSPKSQPAPSSRSHTHAPTPATQKGDTKPRMLASTGVSAMMSLLILSVTLTAMGLGVLWISRRREF